MAFAPSVQSLLADQFYRIAVDANSVASIVAIRDAAMAQMAAGEVSSISSITLNSKTTQFLVSASPVDLLLAAQQAITFWEDGGKITIEVPDFRFLNN